MRYAVVEGGEAGAISGGRIISGYDSETSAAADREATEMSKKNPGKRYWVLRGDYYFIGREPKEVVVNRYEVT